MCRCVLYIRHRGTSVHAPILYVYTCTVYIGVGVSACTRTWQCLTYTHQLPSQCHHLGLTTPLIQGKPRGARSVCIPCPAQCNGCIHTGSLAWTLVLFPTDCWGLFPTDCWCRRQPVECILSEMWEVFVGQRGSYGPSWDELSAFHCTVCLLEMYGHLSGTGDTGKKSIKGNLYDVSDSTLY